MEDKWIKRIIIYGRRLIILKIYEKEYKKSVKDFNFLIGRFGLIIRRIIQIIVNIMGLSRYTLILGLLFLIIYNEILFKIGNGLKKKFKDFLLIFRCSIFLFFFIVLSFEIFRFVVLLEV